MAKIRWATTLNNDELFKLRDAARTGSHRAIEMLFNQAQLVNSYRADYEVLEFEFRQLQKTLLAAEATIKLRSTFNPALRPGIEEHS